MKHSTNHLIAVILIAAHAAFAADLLVPNGGFEQADPKDSAKPFFWDRLDGLGVQWTNAPAGSDGKERGKAIRINTGISEIAMCAQWKKVGLDKWIFPNPEKNNISDTYGLSYYSDPIPVIANQPYKITFDYKSKGTGKVWVRGYGMFQGEKRRRWETTVECRASANDWVTISQEFFPTKFRKEVTEMRVMLYAYYPPDIYWFDNVKIEPITVEEYDKLHKEGANIAHPAPPAHRPGNSSGKKSSPKDP
ncbi:MAG: hypothetical protein WCO56_19135 [Verrucomicrobiota bacterium]